MKSFGIAILTAGQLLCGSVWAAAKTQTIVLIRHAEKPPGGEGRLDCSGLNRAAALPAVIIREFGRPDAIFAPDPGSLKKDDGVKYPYRRPLQTVEPLAKSLNIQVDTRFRYKQIDRLEQALAAPALAGGTVLVAWEHKQLVKLARGLLRDNGGDETGVPRWRGDDFDSIFIVRIIRADGRANAVFEKRRQGLNGQPANCPTGSG